MEQTNFSVQPRYWSLRCTGDAYRDWTSGDTEARLLLHQDGCSIVSVCTVEVLCFKSKELPTEPFEQNILFYLSWTTKFQFAAVIGVFTMEMRWCVTPWFMANPFISFLPSSQGREQEMGQGARLWLKSPRSLTSSWFPLMRPGSWDTRGPVMRGKKRCGCGCKGVCLSGQSKAGPIWTSKTDQHYNIGRTLLRESMSNFWGIFHVVARVKEMSSAELFLEKKHFFAMHISRWWGFFYA